MTEKEALRIIIDFTEDMVSMQNRISGKDKLHYTRGYIAGMKNAGDFVKGMLQGIERGRE